MHKWRFSWFATALAVLLSACTALPFLSGEFRLSADELTQKFAKRFPLEKSVGGLLDVTLAHPRVTLSEADNRLYTEFVISVKPLLSNKTLSGVLKVSGRPDYVPESRALYLRNARVDTIRMENTPDALSAALAKAASSLARETLEDKPLHTFKPEDLTRYGITYAPDRILVRGDNLVLLIR